MTEGWFLIAIAIGAWYVALSNKKVQQKLQDVQQKHPNNENIHQDR